MAVHVLSQGLLHGWLGIGGNATLPLLTATRHAWAGLAAQVPPSGNVTGVCMGTGIMATAAAYDARGTAFADSGPGGVGVVLKAAASYAALERSLQPSGPG